MATTNFTAGKFLSLKNDGSINASGTVEFFSPDGAFSTVKTTYSDSSLSTANSTTITLDSAGRAQIYFIGNADMRVRDSSAATIFTQRNVNPQNTVSITNVTTETTLSASTTGQRITTTAGIIVPTAATSGAGWYAEIKNISDSSINITQSTASDTINGSTSAFALPENHSISISTNAGATGFDIFFNPLLEIDSGSSGQVLSLSGGVPTWTTADIKAMGSKLYMFNNFT